MFSRPCFCVCVLATGCQADGWLLLQSYLNCCKVSPACRLHSVVSPSHHSADCRVTLVWHCCSGGTLLHPGVSSRWVVVLCLQSATTALTRDLLQALQALQATAGSAPLLQPAVQTALPGLSYLPPLSWLARGHKTRRVIISCLQQFDLASNTYSYLHHSQSVELEQDLICFHSTTIKPDCCGYPISSFSFHAVLIRRL